MEAMQEEQGNFFDFVGTKTKKGRPSENPAPTLLVKKLNMKHEQNLKYIHENKSNKKALMSIMSLTESPS